MPVIGFLGVGALDTSVLYLAAFRKDLNEIGFVEGQNVAIEYRWAEGRYDRMPELAADLIRRRVVIIAIPGSPPTVVRAVQAATSAIPIVFGVGDDPVKVGLVASLSRPEATPRASIFSPPNWWQSGWHCCTSWCQGLLALACSSIRPILLASSQC